MLNIKTDATTGASGKLAKSNLVLDGQNSVLNTANVKDMIKLDALLLSALCLDSVG